ncbi:HET-domain-containing protein, partial [Lizonia empirigonia]
MSNIVYPNRLKRSSIRLLELLPSDLDDELECRLVETPLHDITTFEALSYVWGDPAIREPIKCNGQAMTITTNLAQALRRLRLSRAHDHSTGISRVLWADAICINQEDVIERGHQVQLMREIYTKATGVIVWLGADPQGHAKTAFAAIRTICSCLDAYEEVALRSLLNVPWWTRVWCVQEVYFAQQVLLIFGLDGIDGRQFTKFTIWYNREKQFAPYGLNGKERSLKLEETSFNDAFTNFNQKNFNSKDLCMICQSYRIRQATDARDKVYGLLGLWRPRSPEYVIEVDYNKSPAVVYTEVVLQAIKERKSLIV